MISEEKKTKKYIVINDLHQYQLKLLIREIRNYKEFEIPVLKITLNRDKFLEWFMGNISPYDIDEIYILIQKAKKRSANIIPILQTIALALIDRKQD